MPETIQAYSRPSDNVAPNATWDLAAGAAEAGYPVARVANRNPAQAFMATGTSATPRATFGANQVVVGVAIHNHNWAGATSVTITSGAGLSVVATVPPNLGGHCQDFVVDLSAELLAQRTSTVFSVAVVGTVLGNVKVGEIEILTAIRDLRWSWGLKIKPRHHVIRHETFGASHLQYNKRILVHEVTAMVDLSSEEASMTTLEQEAEGEVHPWMLWPHTGSSRVHYVAFRPGTFERLFASEGFTNMPIQADEKSPGPPLFS